MRTEFVLKLHEDLKQVKDERVSDKELRFLIEDIWKFTREGTEDLETNQQAIGIKQLFRGFSIIAWKGTDFNGNKYITYNRIVNQHCMNYYWKCWKDMNEKLHDEEVKRKRFIEWQQKDSTKALEGQNPHVWTLAIKKKTRGGNV